MEYFRFSCKICILLMKRSKLYFVYLADNLEENDKTIKIGMTADLQRRKLELRSVEHRTITKAFAFEGTETQALFVEAFLRKEIEKQYPETAKLNGIDHFTCRNSKIAKAIKNRFEIWIGNAMKVL